MTYDAVIVGGGIAGLTAGALLADAGKRALVVEERPIFGGRALVVRQGGFTLNYGYHFILGAHNSPHGRVFRRLGRKLEGRTTWASGFARLRGGELKRFPADLTTTWRFFGARRGFEYVARGLRWLREPPAPWMRTALGAFLSEQRVSREVEQWLYDIIRAIGFTDRPERFSAGHFLEFIRFNLRQQSRPSLVLPWDRMLEALRDHIVARGGEVRLRAKADAVDVAEGRAAGVRVHGEVVPARVVIVAIPPQRAHRIVPGGVVWSGGRRPAAELVSTAGLSLDLGVEGKFDLPWIAVDVADQGVVVARHSLVDPTLAPPGHDLIQAMRFVAPSDLADPRRVEAHQAEVLRAVDRAFPGATRRAVLTRWLIRPVLTAAVHSAEQPWPELPPVQHPAVRNLLFCGDGYGAPGELSNAAVASAEEAVRITLDCIAAG